MKATDIGLGGFCRRHREMLLYLLFGGLTTLVGWIVYFSIFWTWRALLGVPSDAVTDPLYLKGYTLAQVIQWVAAVLFAFFTNRKWVFNASEQQGHVRVQLPKFAGGRVATFFLDYLVTYFGARLLMKLIPSLSAVVILSRTVNLCDVGAKVIAAVIVIVSNYIVSKFWVFRKPTDQSSRESE